MDRDRNTPVWTQHLALQVDTMEELLAAKARLQADGIEVIGPTDHTLFQSIYFFDPSGHRLELAVNTGTPEMLQKLDDVKWDMLNEWAHTKKAPKHAAWMHDGSHRQVHLIAEPTHETRHPPARRPRRHAGRRQPRPPSRARCRPRWTTGSAARPIAPAGVRCAQRGPRHGAQPFDPAQCHAPLPRAYQWADGSAYLNHVELVRKARGAEMPAASGPIR
jgi:hypothetical protein